MSAQIFLTAPLQLRAEGSRLPSRFSGTAYSGGRVPGYGLVIDLATTQVNKPMHLLNEHSRSSIVGVVEDATNDSRTIGITGKLFSDMPGSDAERIAQLGQRGSPFELSIALFNYSEESVPAGQSVTVNGAVHQGPIVVLRGGAVREVSVCALGADPNTSASFFAEHQARDAEITRLYAALGGPVPDEMRQAMRAMTQVDFLSISNMLLTNSLRSSETPAQPQDAGLQFSVTDIWKQRRAQVAQLAEAEAGNRLASAGTARADAGNRPKVKTLSAEAIYEKRRRDIAALKASGEFDSRRE